MVSGAALAVAHLAEGAAAEGHDVTVIAASEREAGYEEATGRIRVCRLPARDNPARVGQRYLLWPLRQIQALVTSPRPDIVHLHEPLLLGLCTLRIMRRLQIPLVVTLHQLPWFVTKYAPTYGGQPLNVEWLVWRCGGWFMNNGDLPGLYRLATLFVTASEIETFGIVVLEAMTSGCPVVAVKAGALPHLVLTGYSGFLVAPGKPAELADRVAWLLAHPDAAQRMGQNGVALSQEYDGGKSLERHLDLYRAICEG